jgi:predicted nucleic acid-binding protein
MCFKIGKIARTAVFDLMQSAFFSIRTLQCIALKILSLVILQPLNKVTTFPQLLESALSIQYKSKYSFYDSLIIAAAIEAQCATLYSEDMQHGQIIESIRILNPFLTAVNENL